MFVQIFDSCMWIFVILGAIAIFRIGPKIVDGYQRHMSNRYSYGNIYQTAVNFKVILPTYVILTLYWTTTYIILLQHTLYWTYRGYHNFHFTILSARLPNYRPYV